MTIESKHGESAGATVAAVAGDEGRARTLIFVINVDWFFCSHFLHLAQRARREGWRVIVATQFEKARARLEGEGFELVALETRRAGLLPRGLWGAIGTLSDVLKANPGAVMHGFGLFGIVVGMAAARRAGGARHVFTITGRGFAAVAPGLSASLVRAGSRALCGRFADGPGTRWLAENEVDVTAYGLGRARVEGRVAIVGGAGVDPTSFPALPMPPGGALRCALVARAIWSKGHDLAVRAVERARAAGCDIELTLVGAIDESNPRTFSQAQMQAFAAQPGVTWLGQVTDISGLWARHHVAVLPSRGGEGLPKSLLEAAASGRAIITSDVPGCREFGAATHGWVVPADDWEGLAGAMIEASRCGTLAERGAWARQVVLEGYTVECNWQRTRRWYDELAATR